MPEGSDNVVWFPEKLDTLLDKTLVICLPLWEPQVVPTKKARSLCR